MIALAACIKDHWHAVERDLLAMGYHADDTNAAGASAPVAITAA